MADDLVLSEKDLLRQGAEARVYKVQWQGQTVVVKERFAKQYRHPDLDRKLTKQRLRTEVKCLAKCAKLGIDTPKVLRSDEKKSRIITEFITGLTVRDYINALNLNDEADKQKATALADMLGHTIAAMHSGEVVHGDLTTSNFMLRVPADAVASAAAAAAGETKKASISPGVSAAVAVKVPIEQLKLVAIDFGLSYVSRMIEDRAVDLYVLEKAFLSTHPSSEEMFQRVLAAYREKTTGTLPTSKVLEQLNEVRRRGRKRDMIG